MPRTWLLIDCNQLCHAAFHTMKDLSFRGSPTGVIYGFLSSVLKLQDEMHTQNIAYCFDYGRSIRKETYPDYKKKRHSKEYTEEEQIAYNQLHKQIKKLRRKILPTVGFRNVFSQKGYEADDLIASICLANRKKNKLVIVSSDQDMFQLLHRNVSIYNWRTKTTFTKSHFKQKYGITPKKWGIVKAMAGCATDEVAGIRGVGEVSAVKFLKNELKPESKIYGLISEGQKIIKRNLPLVELPFDGTKTCKLKIDKRLDWDPVLSKLGIRSLNPNPEPQLRSLL